MSEFHEINPDKFIQSPFHLIGKVWQLIAAEKDGKVNAMTASWGWALCGAKTRLISLSARSGIQKNLSIRRKRFPYLFSGIVTGIC